MRSTFRKAELLVPGYADAGDQGGFRPSVVEFEGRRCIPAFDTPERVQAFITDESTAIPLSGATLLGSLGPDLDVALNLDTPYAHVIRASPDNLPAGP